MAKDIKMRKNQRCMIITIAGDFGSGKSTVARMVAEKLGYRHCSIGDMMGDLAIERGISLLELSRIAENNREIDEILDSRLKDLGTREDNIVLDSRLGWHFIPDSAKIFLSVDPKEAARRIFSSPRADEKENTSLEATEKNIAIRKESEMRRYRDYYGVNHFDHSNYDIVIDTTRMPAEKVAEKVIGFVKRFR